jgi:ubiquinol-cytochrome c reductase core subunit 2
LSLLSSVLSSTKFTPHEFQEVVVPTVEADSLAALSSPSTLAFDIAHNLAFRRGLGNSLFASPHVALTAEQVKEYASKAYAKSNVAVVGTGISTEALEKAVAKAFGGASASGSASSSGSATQYYGGEQRLPLDVHANGQPTMILAFGSTESSAAPALAVLKNVLGGESDLKWVPGTSPLALAAEKVPGGKAKAFLLPYSDATLFGVVISAPTSEGVKALATEAAAAIKGLGQVSEETVKKAVAKAKFEVASAVEDKQSLIALAGPQVSGTLYPA